MSTGHVSTFCSFRCPDMQLRAVEAWHIKDRKGRSLGRMAGSFEPPTGTTFISGEIAAILRWKKEYGDEDFHHTLRRDSWEVVVPELVFEAS